MAAPISPLPVNAIISIQPVTTATDGGIAATQQLVAQLADGTVVRGFVVNRDPQNNPIIRTEGGDYVIQSSVFVKTGSDVVIKTDSVHANQAHIVSIDNMTPEEYTAQNTRGLSADKIEQSQFKALSQAMQTPTTNQTATTITYPVLRAVMLQTFAQPTALPGQPLPAQPAPAILTQAQAGTNLNVTVYDVKLPVLPVSVNNAATPPQLASLLPQQQTTSSTQPPLLQQATPFAQPQVPLQTVPGLTMPASPLQNTPTPPQTPQASQLPAMPNTLAAPLATAFIAFEPKNLSVPAETKPGNALPVQTPPLPTAQGAPLPTAPAPSTPFVQPTATGQIPSSIPATNTPPNNQIASLPANAGQLIQATVIGHGEDGTSIVHTSFGTMKIDAAQPLPTNTVITLSVQPGTTITPSIPVQTPLLPLHMDFNYLANALTQLNQTDPLLARDVSQHLPVMGPRFTSGLLFFLAAIKSGERKPPLGTSELARLEVNVPGMMTQLSKDIKELQQQFTHSRFEEWKPVDLPFIFNNHAETAQLYIRKEPPDSEGKIEKTSTGQRFLLDLHLSELGEMQLDGFVRQSDRGNALELFMRSELPLEQEISEHIRTLFTSATEAAGLPGNIVFQQGSEHFVKPQPTVNPVNKGPKPNTILA